MSNDKDIGWMYEGPKSLVNREDYLLGKKVDKNFEKYSDAVNDQKPEALDALLHTRTVAKSNTGVNHKTSILETSVIKTEDPLVAVKVKEETKRREMFENPLMKIKFQKMVKELMSKKEKKKEKKSKKKKRKRKDSSSGEDDYDRHKKKKTHGSSGSSSTTSVKHEASRSTKPERHRPLSDKEKAARLKEMQDNASWRNEVRRSNLSKAAEDDKKEEEEGAKFKAPSFIRNHLNDATADLSVERRLHSHKRSLQKSHGYMEKKFAAR